MKISCVAARVPLLNENREIDRYCHISTNPKMLSYAFKATTVGSTNLFVFKGHFRERSIHLVSLLPIML